MNIRLLLTALLFIAASAANAQQAYLKKELALPYIVLEPEVKTTRPPIIVLLHGRGGSETSLLHLVKELPKNAYIIGVRGPIAIPKGYAWYRVDLSKTPPEYTPEDIITSTEKIVKFIDQVVKTYNCDPSRVYLMGFSQGAVMCYSTAATKPEKIKGIAVLSGKIMKEVKPLITNNEQLKQVSMFVAHGKSDGVFIIKNAMEDHTLLSNNHMKCEYHEYDLRHEVYGQEIVDMREWFIKEMARK